jgi:hypothetical protein
MLCCRREEKKFFEIHKTDNNKGFLIFEYLLQKNAKNRNDNFQNNLLYYKNKPIFLEKV